MVGLDAGELVQLVEVDDEAISGHLVDGLVVSDRVVILGDDAGVGSQGNFCIRHGVP